MGSKGSATQTTQNVNQTYSADPRTQQAAGQALQGAEAAAAQPFQMPVAPVAGFSNDQLSAFQNYQNLAGPNSYLNTAAGYAGQAAAPITANDVNQYYNPMADNVTKQLQNIYGQQNSQNQGMLTAQAGGVGADRIAVGMGNLANQQGLASGQIYSQLYQQALQAAQQQKQMAAGAAGQFGQIEQGALGATGALNAAGTQQQQQTQQQLNAPYQNTLARIAYQFQTPQYLAGIAGGLAPALGGQTYGNQVTTPPQPSTLSQVLGIGTAGAGLYGAFGGFGGSGSNPAYGADGIFGGSGSNPLPGLSPSDYGQGYAKGGEVDDEGGPTMSPGQPLEPYPIQIGGSAPDKFGIVHSVQGGSPATASRVQSIPHVEKDDYKRRAAGGAIRRYDDGGATDPMLQFPGTSVPKIGNPEAIPTSALPMGGGHSGMLGGQGIQFAQPQQKSDSGGIGGDIASALGAVSKIIPFLKQGGGIPHYGSGGGDDTNDASPFPFYQPGSPIDKGINALKPGSALDQWADYLQPSHVLGRGLDYLRGTSPQPATDFQQRFPTPNETLPNVPFAPHSQIPLPQARPQDLEKMEKQPGKGGGGGHGGGGGGGGGASTAGIPTAQDNGFTPPYPDALSRDPGQVATRSPWMALVNAGATMAATPGPLGVSLGKGMLAGTASLDKQRTELRSEQELNDKAQQLYDTAQQHLMKYNKMTAYERAEIGLEKQKLEQGETDGTGAIKPLTAYQRSRIDKEIAQEAQAYGWDENRRAQEFIKRTQRASGAAGAAGAPVATTPPTPEHVTQAKSAIASGADPTAVIQRFHQNGINLTPDMLK